MRTVDVTARVADHCSVPTDGLTVRMGSKKEFFYSWRRTGGSIEIVLSDYLDGSPDDVLGLMVDFVHRRSRDKRAAMDPRILQHLDSDGFILRNRPVYIDRSRNLLGSEVGSHFDLMESVDRLLEAGLLVPEDITNSYMSWTRNDNRCRVGFCSTMMRVVGISSVLDSESIPDFVRDYVVYHECLHLRQRYRPDRRSHDRQFRQWESLHPYRTEAERILRKL